MGTMKMAVNIISTLQTPAGSQRTAQSLTRRIRNKSDFPATTDASFSGTIETMGAKRLFTVATGFLEERCVRQRGAHQCFL